MCTPHANSAREAVTKMCTVSLLASENVGSRFVVPTVAGSGARLRHKRCGLVTVVPATEIAVDSRLPFRLRHWARLFAARA
jgi:hypothetical protein